MSDTSAMLEEYQPESTLTIDEYEPYIGQERVTALKQLAASVEGKGWANINSTFVGGGVAEMLRSVIPLARSLGVQARWFTIQGHDAFFQVTKKFHNTLQGVDQPVSLQDLFETYLDNLETNAKNVQLESDLIIVHDPQPAGLIMSGILIGNILWRCHIDTSTPNPTVWRFLAPYINQYAGAIFTMPEFVGPGLQIPQYQITPCIDPRAEKNTQYTENQAKEILSPLFEQHNVDSDRPILAAISRYDIHKNQATILSAFKRLREEKTYDLAPYLILVGNTATDDPEGEAMLEQLQAQAGDDPDVRFWVNVENNDQVIGSLMHLARGFVHVSTKEGFGLVVSEALWQGTPVIGSRVGGIVQQVVDGKTGYLVEPMDVAAIATKMALILDDPEQTAQLGTQAQEHVRQNFLLPELVRRYLTLLQYYTGVNQNHPEFRLNPTSYREMLAQILPTHRSSSALNGGASRPLDTGAVSAARS